MKSPNGIWSNLAGLPVRYAVADDVQRASQARRHEGVVKLRLGHSKGRSYLIPEALIGVAGSRYFIPSFFGPPIFGFHVDGDKHVVRFDMDIGPPREPRATRLVVTVKSEDFVRSFEDGAQVYRCTFTGPRTIARFATGTCKPLDNGDYALQVFHHTTSENVEKIKVSGELWASRWNLAGTRELANVAYTYFTTLPRIADERDLHRIAMASDGQIAFQTTSDRLREEVLVLKVYRGSTAGRTAPLAFYLPSELISPGHLHLHPMTRAEPAYYEVVGSEIIRVGLLPGSTLPFVGRSIDSDRATRKRFAYVVLGDASTVSGLAAPYNEEDTQEVTHIERLDQGRDLFEFWLENQNTDQVTGRTFEAITLKDLT